MEYISCRNLKEEDNFKEDDCEDLVQEIKKYIQCLFDNNQNISQDSQEQEPNRNTDEDNLTYYDDPELVQAIRQYVQSLFDNKPNLHLSQDQILNEGNLALNYDQELIQAIRQYVQNLFENKQKDDGQTDQSKMSNKVNLSRYDPKLIQVIKRYIQDLFENKVPLPLQESPAEELLASCDPKLVQDIKQFVQSLFDSNNNQNVPHQENNSNLSSYDQGIKQYVYTLFDTSICKQKISEEDKIIPAIAKFQKVYNEELQICHFFKELARKVGNWGNKEKNEDWRMKNGDFFKTIQEIDNQNFQECRASMVIQSSFVKKLEEFVREELIRNECHPSSSGDNDRGWIENDPKGSEWEEKIMLGRLKIYKRAFGAIIFHFEALRPILQDIKKSYDGVLALREMQLKDNFLVKKSIGEAELSLDKSMGNVFEGYKKLADIEKQCFLLLRHIDKQDSAIRAMTQILISLEDSLSNEHELRRDADDQRKLLIAEINDVRQKLGMSPRKETKKEETGTGKGVEEGGVTLTLVENGEIEITTEDPIILRKALEVCRKNLSEAQDRIILLEADCVSRAEMSDYNIIVKELEKLKAAEEERKSLEKARNEEKEKAEKMGSLTTTNGNFNDESEVEDGLKSTRSRSQSKASVKNRKKKKSSKRNAKARRTQKGGSSGSAKSSRSRPSSSSSTKSAKKRSKKVKKQAKKSGSLKKKKKTKRTKPKKEKSKK